LTPHVHILARVEFRALGGEWKGGAHGKEPLPVG
jgi:hypothetical protein